MRQLRHRGVKYMPHTSDPSICLYQLSTVLRTLSAALLIHDPPIQPPECWGYPYLPLSPASMFIS